MSLTQAELREIVNNFIVYGDFLVGVPFGGGHVNDTYQLTFDQGGVRLYYILQRINHNAFRHPEHVMENLDRVTAHLLEKIHAAHIETRRRTIRLLRTPAGKSYTYDRCGNCWRAYVFIANARAYDVLETPEQAFRIAQTIGEFQLNLIDLPGKRLHETIPNFHNTPKRLEALENSIRADKAGRVRNVSKEIDFVMARKEECSKLLKLYDEGSIPERITHNDTKANNILIDDLTGEGLCMIDLDTVMPGLSLYDFGDIVRSGTNPAEEDETDLSKVEMRFDMYEALHRGYVDMTSDFLTPAEYENLPFAGKLITLEIGIRFLADYLDGDVYFKTRRAEHNLDRCRTQFKLVESIERQMNKMTALL